MVRILGIDPGEARVGVAVSDPHGSIAVPVGVFQRNGEGNAEALATLAREERVELIVVGLPLLPNGAVGTQARRAQRFGLAIGAASGLPVVFWDERFTSHDANRLLLESGTSRKRRRSGLDATAAAIILQEYLDCHPQAPDASEGFAGHP